MVVADIEAAHSELAGRGVEVSDIQRLPVGRRSCSSRTRTATAGRCSRFSRACREGRMADLKLELVLVPVSDVDRAKAFYTEQLGFTLDVDHAAERRVPRRAADAARLGLLDDDREGHHERRARLVPRHAPRRRRTSRRRATSSSGAGSRSATIRHMTPQGWADGADPEHARLHSFADFADPDGNTWVLQEVRQAGADSALIARARRRARTSVREERHRDPRIAADEHGARDRRRAVAVAHLVERRVERVGPPVLGQRQLDPVGVLEVRQRDADERDPARAGSAASPLARRPRAASRIVCD